jgi:hypothetical protein
MAMRGAWSTPRRLRGEDERANTETMSMTATASSNASLSRHANRAPATDPNLPLAR